MSATEYLMGAAVWVAALALSVGVGAGVVPWVLRRTEPAARGQAAAAVLRGGTWIGLLERGGVTLSLLAGYPEGVAVVVAIKGLGRFNELKQHPDASERFVVGTLASLIWAAAVGLAGRGVQHLLLGA
jgi:hypothetical protein